MKVLSELIEVIITLMTIWTVIGPEGGQKLGQKIVSAIYTVHLKKRGMLEKFRKRLYREAFKEAMDSRAKRLERIIIPLIREVAMVFLFSIHHIVLSFRIYNGWEAVSIMNYVMMAFSLLIALLASKHIAEMFLIVNELDSAADSVVAEWYRQW